MWPLQHSFIFGSRDSVLMSIGRVTTEVRGKRILPEEEKILVPCPRSNRRGTVRNVSFSPIEVSDVEQRTERLMDLLSQGVYAHLKNKEALRKGSPLRGKEN